MARRRLLACGLVLATMAHANQPGRWEHRSDMGVPRQEIGLAAVGETLYAVGGFLGAEPSAAVEAYDTRADRWSPVASLPLALHHVVVAAVDGIVYAAGGLGAATPSGASDTMFAFDPALGAWAARVALPRPRGAGAAGVIDGRIYVVGGLRGTSVRDLAVYDPQTDGWTELAPMPTARDHLAAGVVDGRLYVVGGRTAGRLFDVVEVFDPATGQWSGGRAPMPTARGGLGAAVLGGLLYAAGGEGNTASPSGTFPQLESYDPARDRWRREPDMGVPRHGVGMAAVGGALYVMGGAGRQGLGPSGAGERFLPGAGDVLLIRRLAIVRRGRLVLRGLLVRSGDVDPAGVPARLEIDGAVIGSLPAGSLVASRGGRRWRLRRFPRLAGPAFRRFDLRRLPDGDLRARIVLATSGLPEPGGSVTIAVVLGERAFCGDGQNRPIRADEARDRGRAWRERQVRLRALPVTA